MLIRFLTISDRFIREMSKYASLPSSKDTDMRMEHLLRGMRYLKIKVYPEDELEMSSEFIQSLASLYASPHVASQGLKNAYADTLVHLLHPVIETATAEVNHPLWSKAITLILQKALAAASKPKYWTASFPLVVVALGVSPRDLFMQHWQGCIDAILTKLRVSLFTSKTDGRIALVGLSHSIPSFVYYGYTSIGVQNPSRQRENA